MLARPPERIFRIGNIRLLEEANAYILPQTAGRSLFKLSYARREAPRILREL